MRLVTLTGAFVAALCIQTTLAQVHEGDVFQTSESRFGLLGSSIYMEPKKPAGDAQFYRLVMAPSVFNAEDSTGTNTFPQTTADFTQTSCRQGTTLTSTTYTVDCTKDNFPKQVIFSAATTASDNAVLTITMRVVDSTNAATTLPDGNTVQLVVGNLKMDFGVTFPKGNATTDKLKTRFTVAYKIPETFQDVLDANVKVVNVANLEDLATFKEDASGCTTEIDVDAIVKFKSQFFNSYRRVDDNTAQTLCVDAKDDSSNSKIDITIDWNNIGLPAGNTVTLSVDPSFFIDNGSLAGGFTFLYLLILIILVITLCCCCCIYCCCCRSKDKVSPKGMA